MAALTLNHVVNAGTAGTANTPSASDTADYGNGKNTFLIYRNTSATPLVVSITPPGSTVYGAAAYSAYTVTVPITNGEKWVPLHKELDDGNGTNTATIAHSGLAAGQTVQLVRVDFA